MNILLRYEGGAKGVLQSSQIAVGEENNLRIFIYGEKGGLEWHQQDPNTLIFKMLDGVVKRVRTGVGELSPEAQAATRIPAGHPEGFLEAFANIYRGFTEDVRMVMAGSEAGNELLDYPGIDEAVGGMAFIEAAVASSAENGKWVSLGSYLE